MLIISLSSHSAIRLLLVCESEGDRLKTDLQVLLLLRAQQIFWIINNKDHAHYYKAQSKEQLRGKRYEEN